MQDPIVLGKWYKFINVKYKGQALDLLDAVQNGPIGGYQENNDSRNQSWWPERPHDAPASIYTFTNGTVQNNFVYVGQQVAGSPLKGGDPFRWRVIKVEGTHPAQYRLGIMDASLSWFLKGPKNYDPVDLGSVHDVDPAGNWYIIEDPVQAPPPK